jgi:hypothetical protein
MPLTTPSPLSMAQKEPGTQPHDTKTQSPRRTRLLLDTPSAICRCYLERVVCTEFYRTRSALAAGDLAEVRAVHAAVWVIVADEIEHIVGICAETDYMALGDMEILEERAVDLFETWGPLRADAGCAEGIGQFRAVSTDAIVG